MPRNGNKAEKFDVTKAVKANARARVGQPPVERVIPDETKEQQRQRKHKETLAKLLEKED